MPFFKPAFLLVAWLTLSACSSISVQDYAGNAPVFQPEVFFDGSLLAQGMLKDRSGRVTRRFSADIKAYWRDGIG
ncbi:MAG: DUF3833 domain-containing protein, partial [Congregibacter sp.]|nr:DUF3833 domain-containing protein [Congregibacter sp.]